jgi:RimJ/RimL family protein N-acetyltransferase
LNDLAIVPLRRSHLGRTREWANDPDLARLANRQRPVGEAEHQAWFESMASRSDCAYFAVEQPDEPAHVGNVWLWDVDTRHRKAELRIVIGEPTARGRGLGSAAIELACRHGFEQLHLHRIYAYVLAINPGARRAFEKAGFTLEGTLTDDRWSLDRFIDAHLLARIDPRVS